MTAHTIGGWPGWPVLAGDGVIGSASALLLGAFQPCRHRPLGYDPGDLGGGQRPITDDHRCAAAGQRRVRGVGLDLVGGREAR